MESRVLALNMKNVPLSPIMEFGPGDVVRPMSNPGLRLASVWSQEHLWVQP